MILSNLSVHHVRVIEQAKLDLSPRINVIFGDNGSGKTSLLEAISILSQGRSFRTHRIHHLLPPNQEALTISTQCRSNLDASVNQMGIEKKKAQAAFASTENVSTHRLS